MPRRLARSVLGALLLGSALALTASAAGPTRHVLSHGGLERVYYLDTPPAAPAGLVLALHGGRGRPRTMMRVDRGRLSREAARRNLLLAFPAGVDRSWNDGREIPAIGSQRRGVDDVGFLVALVEELIARHRVPRDRVFATGVSNGGFMSFRLACEASEVFAAVAPVIANLSENLASSCAPGRSTSVAILDGTEDPLVPYQGGAVRVLGRERGEILSAPESARYFARHLDCDELPATSVLPDRDPRDGTRTRVHRFTGCRDGAEVELLSIQGGGHTWPGGVQYLPRFLVGRVSRDFHASDRILDFFDRTTPAATP